MRWPGHGLALGLAAGILAAWLVLMLLIMRAAELSAEASGPMLAVFEPGLAADDVFARLTRANAKPIRETWLGFVWVVTGDEPGLVARLKRQGAVGAYAEMPFSPTLAGCFGYADAKLAELLVVKP